VRCGALYLLASCAHPDIVGANESLQEALTLCDDMDEVNEREGVTIGMVPHERVSAMREQLLKLKNMDNTLASPSQAIISRPATPPPPSSRTSSPPLYPKKRVRLVTSPTTIEDKSNSNEDKSNANEDSNSSNTSFATAPLGNENSEEIRIPQIDRCHIAELEFELTQARDEESRSRRRVVAARNKRERIEEKLLKMRRLMELQRM
jgi:hypothetical protein